MPPTAPEFFLPVKSQGDPEADLYYEPMLFGIGRLYYADAKAGVAVEDRSALLMECRENPDWDKAQALNILEDRLEKFPEDEECLFGELPSSLSQPKHYPRWSKEFRDWLYRNRSLELMKSASLGIVSSPGESEMDCRIRLKQSSREKRDENVDRLRAKYTSKIETLQIRIKNPSTPFRENRNRPSSKNCKHTSPWALHSFRPCWAARGPARHPWAGQQQPPQRAGRIFKESKDIDPAPDNLKTLQELVVQIQGQLEEETRAIMDQMDPLTQSTLPSSPRHGHSIS